jgi:hypothetical protein
MKLTGMGVSVSAVPRAGLVEQAKFLRSSFLAAGFEAVGAIGQAVRGDPTAELGGEAQAFDDGGRRQEQQAEAV